MSKQIIRITLFKMPSESDIEAALAKYSTLQGTAVKDGKPYILSARAFKTYDDPRNNGFTVCGRTVFSSLEDMKYYDEDCEAHKELKAEFKGKVAMPGGVMTVYMDGDA